MPDNPLLSIVINNYNYGRFLAEAIDSALAQDDDRFEVVVVDDGSTDDSRAIIASYGDRVRPVLKANGGQGSAFNAGFAASRGDFILFLDADDRLTPQTLSGTLHLMKDPRISHIHGQLLQMTEDGQLTGEVIPRRSLLEGDLRQMILDWGPFALPIASCSGNIWSRRFLEQVMPMPEEPYRICADGYLLILGGLFGRVAIRTPFAHYRVHGNNNHWRSQISLYALRRDASVFEANANALTHWAGKLGLTVKPERWVQRDWRYQLRRHLLWRAGERADGPHAIDVLRAVWMAQSRLPMKIVLLTAFAILLPLPRAVSFDVLCRMISYHLIGPSLFLPWKRA